MPSGILPPELRAVEGLLSGDKTFTGKFRGHHTNFFDPDGGNENMAIIFRRSLS